jgi:hypothetical protein
VLPNSARTTKTRSVVSRASSILVLGARAGVGGLADLDNGAIAATLGLLLAVQNRREALLQKLAALVLERVGQFVAGH